MKMEVRGGRTIQRCKTSGALTGGSNVQTQMDRGSNSLAVAILNDSIDLSSVAFIPNPSNRVSHQSFSVSTMVSPSSILLRSTISKTITRSLQTATTSASSTPSIDPSLFSPNTSYLAPTHLDDSPSPATLERLAKYSSVSLATYSRPPFILTHGKKCSIWDADGREYLDFSGGIAVNALGHSDEGVQKVLSEQSGKLVHNSNLWHNEWAGELALLLVEKTKELGGLGYEATTTSPASSEREADSHSSGLKVFFSNSGTEANEGALKFARKWGKLSSPSTFPSTLQKACGCTTCTCKSELVSFKDGFHGRSMGALSATWQDKYQAPFAPLVPGFRMGVLNDIEGLKESITERTCGVIVEPIQVSFSSRFHSIQIFRI